MTTHHDVFAVLVDQTEDDAAALLCGLPLDDLIGTLVTLAEHDVALLETLVSRRDVSATLKDSFRLKTSQYTVHPAPLLVTVTVCCIASYRRTGITFTHSYIVAGIARRVDPNERHLYYQELVAELTTKERYDHLTAFGGLYYILVDAAKAEFEKRDSARALQLNDAARSLRDSLPDTPQSARARFQGAVQFVNLVAHTSPDRLAELMPAALEDLHTELANVVARVGNGAGVFRLRAVLTETQIWGAAGAVGIHGQITSAETRIDLLCRALADLYGARVGADGAPDRNRLEEVVSTVPADEKSSLGRVVVELAQAYAHLGRHDLATEWAEYARTHELSPRSILDLNLLIARFAGESSTTIGICERFLRQQLTGMFSSTRWDRRERALRGYATTATHLAKTLKSNGEHASAKFWKWQAKFWRKESQDVKTARVAPYAVMGSRAEHRVDPETIENYLRYVRTEREPAAPEPDPGSRPMRSETQRARQRARKRRSRQQSPPTAFDEFAGEPPPTDDDANTALAPSSDESVIRDLVRENLVNRFAGFQELVDREKVGETITVLTTIIQSHRLELDDELKSLMVRALASLAAWRPALFGTLSARFPTAAGHSLQVVATASLTAAATLADHYAPHRLVPVLLLLSGRFRKFLGG